MKKIKHSKFKNTGFIFELSEDGLPALTNADVENLLNINIIYDESFYKWFLGRICREY